MFSIVEANTPAHLDNVRALMGEYIAWHYSRHAFYRHLIERYFDRSLIAAELAGLPGEFAPPRGCLLLGLLGTRACGTVGIRDLGNAACELKRMFVSHEARGKGLGKALIARLIQQARDMGYRHMRLDTGPFQHEAHRLYRDVGFSEIPPYYDVEPELRSWLMFMELDLVGSRARQADLCHFQPAPGE